MIECRNNMNGVCTIATYLAKNQVVAMARESTCNACVSMEHPMSINKATCGLAILYLNKEKRFLTNEFDHLLTCGATLFSPEGGVKDRPGAALTQILSGIGVKEPSTCYCMEYAASMDSWGWKGCTLRKIEIVSHLNNQQVSWFDMLKVASAGYLTTGSLVDYALEMSKP